MVSTRAADRLRAFEAVTSRVETAGIPYVLSGGTLLGAVRDGALIPHDPDFDLEFDRDDEARVRALQDDLAALGIELRVKQRNGIGLADGRPGPDGGCHASNLQVYADGRHVGDLLFFTMFDDGIARRYDAATRTLYNPRMMIPAWYLEEPRTARIGTRSYPVVRDAALVLEVTYGPDWRRPIAPGDFTAGSNPRSGAVYDKPTERLIEHALAQGWDGDYRDRPSWPPRVTYVNSHAARRWVFRHEPELVSTDILTRAHRLAGRDRAAGLRAHHQRRLDAIAIGQAFAAAEARWQRTQHRRSREERQVLEAELAEFRAREAERRHRRRWLRRLRRPVRSLQNLRARRRRR
ncbi:MAG: hypothetical protein EA340_05005 [Nitriliruptor sp.]|nr:MAG: hypothetical protein EA340_05005 [Nitriliruptor sp.]